MAVNVGQILRAAAVQWPERVALVDVGRAETGVRREFTFAQLDERARVIAALLRSSGAVLGDAIALIGEGSAEFVAAWFAIAYTGCAVVPIPILSAAPELRYRVEHARCKLVLFDAERAALVHEAVAGLAAAPACIDLADAARSPLPPIPPAELATTAPDDAAMLLYTSGTTGKPKAAAISHAALTLHTAVLAQHALRLGQDDCVLGVLPLTHSFGCRMVMLASFFVGARCVVVPRFDAARTLGLLESERVTWFPAVPTMYAAWAAVPGEALSGIAPALRGDAWNGTAPALRPALRWTLCAGAPLTDETCRRAERRLGAEIRQGYGLTEATFCTMNAPPDQRVFGSVGKPVWGVDVRVVAEDGSDVAQGQDGEVVVRGHNTMSGYLRDPEATAAVWKGGFLHTGDIGRFDAAGRLVLVDRLKDMIIRGGYNVYPSELEDVIAAHPDVHHVAVIGRPDDYYGEEIVAVIVLRAGAALDAAELARWAAERVGKTKRPREVAFVDALPLGPSGKVLKRTLREWLQQGRLSVVKAG